MAGLASRLPTSPTRQHPLSPLDISSSSARVQEVVVTTTGFAGTGEGVRQRRTRQNSGPAPSYAESEYLEIVRRQNRTRSAANSLKLPRHHTASSSYPSPSPDPDPASTLATPSKDPPKLSNEWEFSGWGHSSYVELTGEEVAHARREREQQMRRDGDGSLGSWLASGVAGVAVASSPLYAFPALVSVATVYSPISLFVATLLLAFWRPIMAELAAAFPISGANYAYLLNTSTSVSFALIGASLTLLDDIATSVVAAATASSYIVEQAKHGVGETWLTMVLLFGIAGIGLVGMRGSASVTLATLTIHLLTLAILMLASVAHWARNGNSTLAANWHAGQVGSAEKIAKAIYQGICIAFLGVTGFETAPDYCSSLRPASHVYPTVLRSLQYIAVVINAPLLLCTFAVLPLDEILGVPSVLGALGRTSAGGWLSILVTVDAVLILAATVLAGLVSATALLHRLSRDGLLPQALLKPLPVTGVPAFAVALFTALCIIVYGSSGASLNVVSSMFAIVFLAVMSFYPVSLLLLQYHRPTMPRLARRTPFLLTVSTLLLALALISGVISLNPTSVGYFAAYMCVLTLALWTAARWGRWLRVFRWVCEHGLGWRRGAEWCVRMMAKAKEGKEVVLFVKGDEINTLFERILYVQKNETTSRIKLVHFYGPQSASNPAAQAEKVDSGEEEAVESSGGATVTSTSITAARVPQDGHGDVRADDLDDIPSELTPNWRILDEAFPSITIDLVFLRAPFTPDYIHALAMHLQLSVSRMFVGCPSERWEREKDFGVRELGGVRIISG
ncbi:hypothetical protein NBRC10512_007753 [Rhodotorula toruloides]|uniref:RHTO0S01e16600g1_1 n=2 Tax=Rhodotorula toruloides TaxID=5286 RepID=A0A061ALI3_RHOTO|nr:amino acid transmembrane transporter [Rhodotorula toruloides NP11]EMS19633.1 amino acid transmembrane transporter [Rhodotorula toruloides NP11]CDR36207.1 RHTO0S01e16600g1_1 [Rhodotorula toruloides]